MIRHSCATQYSTELSTLLSSRQSLPLKPGFHYLSWWVTGFHYPSTWKPVTRQLGPSTRVVETGLQLMSTGAPGMNHVHHTRWRCLPTHVGRFTSSVDHVPSLLQTITGLANWGIRTYPSLHCMTARSPGIKPPDSSTTTPLAMSGCAHPPITTVNKVSQCTQSTDAEHSSTGEKALRCIQSITGILISASACDDTPSEQTPLLMLRLIQVQSKSKITK